MYHSKDCKFGLASRHCSGEGIHKESRQQNDGRFVDGLPQRIPTNLRARYEEIEPSLEPIIELQHPTTSSIHEKFSAIDAFNAFTSFAFSTAPSPHPMWKSCLPRIISVGLRTWHDFWGHMGEFSNTAWWVLVVVKVLILRKYSNRLPNRTELRVQWLSTKQAWWRLQSVVIRSWRTSPIPPTQGFSTMWNFCSTNPMVVSWLAEHR